MTELRSQVLETSVFTCWDILPALLLVLNINFSNISNGPQVSLESELSRSILFSVAVLGFVFIFASSVP